MKIPARRVPSDDCLVYVDRRIDGGQIVDPGVGHKVHEGEWIEVIPVGSIRKYLALTRLGKSVSANDFDALENSLDELCVEISERVTAWNWTDLDSQPLPCPYKNPDVIKRLTEDEMIYLITACQGETPGERKNA